MAVQKMAAGRLDQRLQFFVRVAQEDGSGNFEGAFVPQFEMAANRKVLRGGETVMAGRLQNVQKVIVTVRNCENARRITAGWKAQDARSGVEYAIHEDPQLSDDRLWLEMLCQSGVATG
ncbi:head-tail adaptor protein [Mesorhizobium sp.]|uniref:head-tail adaptor protein n=1 Tax=Mesorhizobium sp. TaxID=1871066 RepID=UPI00120AC3A9|nr:head-tail adaptor protein [Mesorhizobium sp.]TIN10388.1 MAG: head-tail adaptor protein [Mesorhizobium sp.]